MDSPGCSTDEICLAEDEEGRGALLLLVRLLLLPHGEGLGE